MKILFICENYLPHIGGAEVVFKNLAEGYLKQGHTVSLLTHQLKKTTKRETINGVKVYRVPSFHSRYAFTFLAIFKAISLAKRHDIIQTTTFNGAPPAWLAARLTGKPVVLTVHEIWVGKWKKVTGFSWMKSFVHDLLERAIYLLPFDKYVSVSKATGNDLIKSGIKKNKIEVIYNGLNYQLWDTKNFKEKRIKEIKQELGLENNSVCFSWGRPGPSKGFEYVIKAMPGIIKKIPNAVLLLMLGSADQYKDKYQELVELIDKLGIKDKIKMVPSVSYQELGHYVKLADCVVVPSLAEGFGYTTVEAGALDKPVVVSDAGSLPEVVSGKHLIFKSKNVKDLADKVVMISKGDYLKTKKKIFKWDKSIQKYLAVYTKLMKKN